ncbi:hypothetical protein LEN26_006289 [Aphanomyces euteiches]|nr:hypothetical protein AeMF1_009410 [Aphanomyces euteiches]KAH9136042.1 hypothetical protein LEN26_006289 [Aphanomyces euteiches]KAH9197724.1 hypothetical protein AeNC1_000308 [Aphanomyces euteiches]
MCEMLTVNDSAITMPTVLYTKKTMSMKRPRAGDTQSLEKLSLSLKMRSLVVEAHMTNLNRDAIERNLVSIANELALLFAFGIHDEATCLRFLTSAHERVLKLTEMKRASLYLSTTPESIWQTAKTQALSTDDAVANMNRCYENTIDDISLFWKQMQAAKDKAAELWNEDKLQEAMPYMRAADTYFKRSHLKYQKLNVDYAMIGAQCLPVVKKTKRGRVSFSDKPVVMGTAEADVDRSPICPSKPTPMEALLLRASREFPMPSF